MMMTSDIHPQEEQEEQDDSKAVRFTSSVTRSPKRIQHIIRIDYYEEASGLRTQRKSSLLSVNNYLVGRIQQARDRAGPLCMTIRV